MVTCRLSSDPRKQPSLANENDDAPMLVAVHTDAYSGEWLVGRACANGSMIDLEGS